MRILVTGGTVFVSRAVAEWFVQRGDTVYVLNRDTRSQAEGVELIRADRHLLGEKLRQYCFDAVLDMTAYTAQDVSDLLDALGDFGQYVLLSSSAVYPETNPQPFREDQMLGANTFWGDYGSNKIGAESTLLQRVPAAYILRPPYLCGAGNNLYREAFVFECAERGLPFCVPGDGSLPLQFCHIGDLCRLLEIIVTKHPQQHILNTGDPQTVSAADWVRICYAAAEMPCILRYLPREIPVRAYFPFRDYAYRLDVAAQTALLPELTPLEDSMREAYAWWQVHRETVVRKPYLDYLAQLDLR